MFVRTWFGIVFFAVFVASANAECFATPTVPTNTQFYDVSSITFTWSTSNTCTNTTIYKVVLTQPNQQVPDMTKVLCETVGQTSCTASNLTSLNVFYLNSLSVEYAVVAQITPGNYSHPPASFSLINYCQSLPPVSTNLTAPQMNANFSIATSEQNTTVVQIIFIWDSLYEKKLDFGRACVSQPKYNFEFVANQNRTLLLNGNFTVSKTVANVENSTVLTAGKAAVAFHGIGLGSWYWQILTANNNFTAASEIFEFNVVITPDPCTPICVPGQGNCSVSPPLTNGHCICNPGYSGTSCNVVNIPSVPPSNNSSNTGLIAGVVVAGGVVLLAIVLALLYVLRERRKARKDLEMSLILIEAPDFGKLAWEPYGLATNEKLDSAKKTAWTRFEQLILAQDYSLVFALTDFAKINQMDSICSALVCVFEKHLAGASVVLALMKREIEVFEQTKANKVDPDANGNEANPMPFRGDSAATKAFKVYSRVVGLPYLFDTLGQILNDFCAVLDEEAKKQESQVEDESEKDSLRGDATPSRRSTFNPSSTEVDPSRMTSAEDETINRLSLQLICQKVFVKIYRSAATFPTELRTLCSRVREEASKHENLKSINLNVLISNLVFLRFINPAVLMPYHHGLVKEEPMQSTKRQLVLITKVLQNLASGVEFGKKEPYMTKLNPFIQQNSEKMQSFLTELVNAQSIQNVPEEVSKAIVNYTAPINDEKFNAALINLYKFVQQNLDGVLEQLAKDVPSSRLEPIKNSLLATLNEIGTI